MVSPPSSPAPRQRVGRGAIVGSVRQLIMATAPISYAAFAMQHAALTTEYTARAVAAGGTVS